jgi:catalase
MKKEKTIACILTGTLALAAFPGIAVAAEVTPSQVVEALEGTFGVHPGERRNHIKGLCAEGEFIGDKQARPYSSSALFSGKPVPVIARFSVAGGNPKAPDTARSARGMALEFHLPGDKLQHITMINTPMFGAAQPQTFYDSILALKPDPATGKPDPEKVKAFKASHPDNLAQTQFLEKNNPPVSYANSAYFGIHTFKFIDKRKRPTLVRWRFVPKDGEKRLSDDEMKTAGADFLEGALIDRVKKSSVQWDMIVTIGQAGDPEDNPTLAWPEGRKEIHAGTLTIKSAEPQKTGKCGPINFDPLVMAEGIAPTNDPILRFRSPAYAVSFSKRMSGQ